MDDVAFLRGVREGTFPKERFGHRMHLRLALIFLRGSINAVDNPARQSFVVEMVGPDRVVNAVSLNSVIVHTARIAGPAAAIR